MCNEPTRNSININKSFCTHRLLISIVHTDYEYRQARTRKVIDKQEANVQRIGALFPRQDAEATALLEALDVLLSFAHIWWRAQATCVQYTILVHIQVSRPVAVGVRSNTGGEHKYYE